jgi:PD-(D/E)XK nuclease superfamily
MKSYDNIKSWKLDELLVGIIRDAVTDSTVTQSEMMCRASCARKWLYRYGMQLSRRGYLDLNLVYGDILHKLLAKLYSSEDDYAYPPDERPIELDDDEKLLVEVDQSLLTPNDREEIVIMLEKVRIAFNAYRQHYHTLDQHIDVYAVEHTFELPYVDFVLAGAIDMVAKPDVLDGIFIWDWKSTSRFDALILDTWAFRFQFLFYAWLWWKLTGEKPTGIMVQGLLKSQLRPKQITEKKNKRTETRKEYLYRVRGDMTASRERYFYRQRLPLGSGALERFENEMLCPHLHAFSALREGTGKPFVKLPVAAIDGLAMAMNTGQCHVYGHYCEYLNLCKDGPSAIGEYDRRQWKHPELVAKENNVK